MGIPFIGIVAVLGITGLSLLALLLFGIRSFAHGKVSPITTGAVLLPVVLLVILGFVTGDWPAAAIYTLLIMLGITALAMVLSSVRGVIGMR